MSSDTHSNQDPTTKPDDPKDATDEALALSCSSGNNPAFDILFHRYKEIVRLFFLGKSWFRKDDQYIDELMEQVFVVIWQCLKANKFESKGAGSFRKWLFSVCQLECYKQDSKRAKLPMVTSALFPASFSNIPVSAKTQPEPEKDLLRQAEINAKFKEVQAKLTPKEQYLMQLVGDRVKYKDIIKKPEFSNYSVAGIKQKIYNIRKRFNEPGKCQVIRPGTENPEVKNCPSYIAFNAA